MVKFSAIIMALALIVTGVLMFMSGHMSSSFDDIMNRYPGISFVLLAMLSISLWLYFYSDLKAPVVTTKARLIKKTFDNSLVFQLPNKKTFKVYRPPISWEPLKVGDIVILKYKGTETISVKKVSTKPPPQPATGKS